jgi:hypothetical protein
LAGKTESKRSRRACAWPIGIDLSEVNTGGGSGGKPIILLDYEVQSRGSEAPMLENEQAFQMWLEAAHSVIHDWFFASIEGPLRATYEKE